MAISNWHGIIAHAIWVLFFGTENELKFDEFKSVSCKELGYVSLKFS